MSLRLVRLPSGAWSLVAVPEAQHVPRANAAPSGGTLRGEPLAPLSPPFVSHERRES